MGFPIFAGLPAGWSSPERAIDQKLAAEVRSTFGLEAVKEVFSCVLHTSPIVF